MSARSLALALAVVAGAVFVPASPAGTATEIPVLTSPDGEFQPARGDGVLGWEQNTKAQPNHYDVMVRRDGSSPTQVNRGRSMAAMGDFVGDRLVYQQYRKRRSDLWFYDLTTGARTKVTGVNSNQWEYWPSIYGDWLLFGRWNRSNDVRRLFLQNLATGERRLLDRTKRAKAFIGPGQVEGNYAVWSTCDLRCNVFRYEISAGTEQMIQNPGFHQRAPSVTGGGTVYFSRGGKGCGASVALVRAPLDGPQEVLVQLQSVLDMRDTYAYTESNGSTTVYYERNGCGKAAASDIYQVRVPTLFGLVVELAGTGGGTVTSSPPGIACGADCSEEFEQGTEVLLTAGSGPGSTFVGWTGGCTGSGPCAITMDSPQGVTATFQPLASVTIIEDSVPDHAQDFEFDNDLGSLNFFLDDDADLTLSNSRLFPGIDPGTYHVQEVNVPAGWQLTGIQCLDPDGGSAGDLGTRMATIDFDPNEAIQCTFTNTQS